MKFEKITTETKQEIKKFVLLNTDKTIFSNVKRQNKQTLTGAKK